MAQNQPTHSTAAELIPDLCQVGAVLWLVLFSEALRHIVLLRIMGGAHQCRVFMPGASACGTFNP